MTSRERRIEWLKAHTSGRYGDSVDALLLRMFRRHGFDWLTDDQVDQLTEEKVGDEKFSRRLAIHARETLRAGRR